MANMTIREIIKLSPEQKKLYYRVSGLENKHIDIVKIDDTPFTDFSAFSFLNEKSFIKSPQRSSDGSIGNLDSYAWFLTPHLKIDFSLLSIDSYRDIMKLIQSKNEFTVTCYDPVEDKDVTHKMYFTTEQMPKLWTIAKALNGGTSWVELLGVQDYTIELVGTNTDVKTSKITYNLNIPANTTWRGDTSVSVDVASNMTTAFGVSVGNGVYDNNGDEEKVNATNIQFMDEKGNIYIFGYWCANSSGTGFRYVDGDEYRIANDTTVYAIWKVSAPR